jgi:hypothetical protein
MGWRKDSPGWITQDHSEYKLNFTEKDKENIKEYVLLFDNGIKLPAIFFDDSFKEKFDIFVHPNRQSIDSQWASDWKITGFKSECWMVASGIAGRFDLISPKTWEKESCEHLYTDKTQTQQLITHELIHVFHGQISKSSDFSDFEGLDWFVEGLATYASGQCNDSRISEIKKAIERTEIPSSLDNFWSGKMKYGLSGSMVMYIDREFGRSKLKALLKIKIKAELLEELKLSEAELLIGWESYLKNL